MYSLCPSILIIHNQLENGIDLLRDNGIAQSFQSSCSMGDFVRDRARWFPRFLLLFWERGPSMSVQPTGNPIRHSTHSGLSLPFDVVGSIFATACRSGE